MHLGAADEVQVAAEAHKFHKSSRDQQELQPLMSDGCKRMDACPGDRLLMLSNPHQTSGSGWWQISCELLQKHVWLDGFQSRDPPGLDFRFLVSSS